jgi:hypothetical protein
MLNRAGYQGFLEIFVDDKVKCVCSKCHKLFWEKAVRMKNGYQMQCPHCMKLITFDSGSEDANIRRPLKAARAIRVAAEDAIAMAKMAPQEPKREPTY